MKRILLTAAALAGVTLSFTACGGGGGSSGPSGPVPPVTQTNPPAPPPVTQSSADCPASGPAAQSAASGAGTLSTRRAANSDDAWEKYVPGLISVTYTGDDAGRRIAGVAASIDARRSADLELQSIGLRVRSLSVEPARVSAAIAQLRATPGVRSVERAQYRHLLSIVHVNDPYYNGFGPQAPYYESSSIPGQWDMHLIHVSTAWGYYSQIPAVGAPIAVIDTGVDVTHPELRGGKITRQYCYVTYPSSAAQSSGPYAVDTDGHGTNVAGITDADTNNSFGFAGVAFDAPLLAYRIFPSTPSGGCENSKSAQCSTTDVDEASAINDAVAHGAKVINLSLGSGGPLSECSDSVEENAVEAAIARGVAVVAAAGNGKQVNGVGVGQNYLDCPAAYPGVIAVGADGPSGSSQADAVAGYSNWTSSAGPGSGGAYLVAPGGTANSGNDSDDLHFVENITSSQMAGASAYCRTDYAGEGGDCRGGFSGTSQATPHVAGVVSLMLGLRPSLTPARIASDLCSTAHDIGDTRQGCGRVDAGAAVAKALTQ